MHKINIKLVDTVFEINCCFDYFCNLAKNYITNENATCFIEISDEDIESERIKSEKFNRENNIGETALKIEELESFSILGKVADYFIDKNIIVFHGAAVSKDEEGYLFVSPSSVGKTTHISLWINQFDNTYPINGDMPLIIIKDNNVFVSGSPWAGKENLQTNKIVPLKAICFINRSDTNKIWKINDTDLIFEKLYGHVLKKNNMLLSIVKCLKAIIEEVDFYCLECNMEKEAAIVSYEGMNNQ